MDHLTLVIAANASPNEVRKLATSLDAVHPLVEVDAHLDAPANHNLDSVWLWTPWGSSGEQRCERAIKACIGWVGSRAPRVRCAHQVVVLGADDRTLFAAEITWPRRQILDLTPETVPARPQART